MTKYLWGFLLFLSHVVYSADLVIEDSFVNRNLNFPLATAIDFANSTPQSILETAHFNTNLYNSSVTPNTDIFWYRIDLDGRLLTQEKRLSFVFQNHLLQHLDLYLFRQGREIRTKQLGINDREDTNGLYRGVLFEFRIQPDDQLTLLIRKKSDGPAIMPLELMNQESFNRQQINILLLWGIVIGVFLALALYNGFIFSLNNRSAQYAWYLLFQLFMFLQFAPLHGFGYLIFPESFCRWLGNHMGVLHQVILWCALMFGYHFLDIKKYQPVIGWLIEKSVWVVPAFLLLSIQLTELQRIYINSPLILLVSFTCIGVAIVAMRNRYYPAYYYLLSWLCTFFGAICGYLTYINILPQNIFTLHSFMIGSLAELYLLSVSLAKRLQYQEKQEKQYRMLDQTLNMPNQNFYQYGLKDQLVKQGVDLSKTRLVLIRLEGSDHLISTLGTERVYNEARIVFSNIGSQVSKLDWHINLEMNESYFGISIPPFQTLIMVKDQESPEKQIISLLDIWHQQLDKSLYLSDLYIRASSVTNEEGNGINGLHRRAYMALLDAQKKGIRWQEYDENMTEEAESRVKILHELKLAISDKELDIFIQPQIDLMTDKVIGGEVLMRWYHTHMGMISPGVFIPIAEQSGLIHNITRIALEKMFAWMASHKIHLNMSVNISVLDIQEKDFIGFLTFLSQKYVVNPRTITLEITESQELDRSNLFVNKLLAVENLGFKISIDDFGTGYSSMAYLSQLNIHEVKVDMMFVKGIQDNDTNQTIVKTLLNMAEALGAETVIEGIESIDELNTIKKLGAHIGQGYFWSKAISVREFEEKYLPVIDLEVSESVNEQQPV